MAYKVVETALAIQDLDHILSYLVHYVENPYAAASFADAVQECYCNLKNMPLMYEACRDARLFALGYRKAVIRNYIMVYKVEEREKTVFILRFFHGSQNYEKIL